MDQLKDTEIDLTKYLKNFSDSNYTLELMNDQPILSVIKNIFSQSTFIKNFKTDAGFNFSDYLIEEGELPEDVSLQFYNSVDYWWIICLFNDITNPLTQWPLNENQIFTIMGDLILKENKYSPITYYNLLFEMNEKRRNIRILESSDLLDVIKSLRDFIGNNSGESFTVIV